MRNLKTCYPISGSAALRPSATNDIPIRRGAIVAFPGNEASCVPPDPQASQFGIVQNLKYGTARGVSYNCIERWQAVIAGCTFSAIALATVIFGF